MSSSAVARAAPIEMVRLTVTPAADTGVRDTVLMELARRLQDGLRPTDCLSRWGGEEFAVLLRGVDSDEELDRLAQRLCDGVGRTPVAAQGVDLRLTVSIGGVRAAGRHDTLDSLVEAADRCLYVAKREGRDRVSLVPQRPGGAPAPTALPAVTTGLPAR